MSVRQRLREACAGDDLAAAQRLVAEVLAADGGTAAVQFAANRVGEMAARLALPELRLAILASFTIDPIHPHLVLRAFLAGWRLTFDSVPYEQWYAALAEPGPLDGFDAHVLFLLLHLEDVAPLLARRHLAASGELDAEADRIIGAIEEAIRGFRARGTAPVVLSTFIAAERGIERFFDRRVLPSRQGRIDALNARLSELAMANLNVFVLDYAQTVTDFGRRMWFDRVKGHHVKAAVAARALPVLAAELLDFVVALTEPRKKVVAVDLDNTLWGGIVGEDGADGVAVAGDYPGNAFADFQAFLANLRASGLALAVASKNNRADAEEVFRRNPEMPLKWDDFAAHRIDWNDKPANLKALAEELNLGLESFLFVDDSPLDCDLVRTYAPEVTVVQASGSPSLFPERILAAGGLYAVSLTEEDRRRADGYASERTRAALAATTDTRSFLAKLGLRLTLRPPSDGEIERVSQLFNKTNQFNLTAKRYCLADVMAMRADPSFRLKVMRLADRYGEYGLIGVVVTVDGDDRSREIDSFLISCRALGRNVEQAIVADVEAEARADGIERLLGRYRATARNGMVADFYPKLGFTNAGGEGLFERDLRTTPPLAGCAHITVVRQGAPR